MKYGSITIMKNEYDLLLRNISNGRSREDAVYRASIKKLQAELKTAKIVKNGDIAEDIIRYNSFVTIETPFTKEQTYQIVTPEKSNISKNQISILSPMGLALIGYAQEDEITWQFPTGMNTIKIIKVAQQELVLRK